MKFRDKFIRFMYGRYGADELYRFTNIVFFVLVLVNCFVRTWIIYVMLLGILMWQFSRLFSRNIPARQRENRKYLSMRNAFTGFFKRTYMRIRDYRSFRYRRCPSCRATLRLPAKKREAYDQMSEVRQGIRSEDLRHHRTYDAAMLRDGKSFFNKK